MSTPMWLDDTDVESGEYDESEGGELYDGDVDSEGYDEESRSAAARRRKAARARRIALARHRQGLAGARAPSRARPPITPRPPAQREAITAIRKLDLETKVQEDSFRGAIAAQNKRMSRSEYAAVLGAVVNQFIESFDAPDNPFLKAGLRFAPLLLLSPQKKGSGFEAFIKDPRVIGGTAVAGITVLGENRNLFRRAKTISVLGPTELAAGDEDQFVADVLDGQGTVLDETVKWKSSEPTVARIDEVTGKVKAENPGTAIITASFEGIVGRVRLKVVARGGIG